MKRALKRFVVGVATLAVIVGVAGAGASAANAVPGIAIQPAFLPVWTAGQSLPPVSFGAAGGTAPYSFMVTGGALPTGLQLSSVGVLSGTPTVPGVFAITVGATDAQADTGTATYTLVVSAPIVAVGPDVLAPLQAGSAHSERLTASGGTGPYSFAVTGGALPRGMDLLADGTLVGTPTSVGAFSFVVTATDANGFIGAAGYASMVALPTLTLTPTSLDAMTVGTPFSATLQGSGGIAPWTYYTLDVLPPGLSLSSETGAISGTPSEAGSWTFTIRAQDSTTGTGSPYAVAQSYSVTVAAPPLTIDAGRLPDAVAGLAYAHTVTAAGGVAPYSFAIAAPGVLPAGLHLAADGTFSGTPTTPGDTSFDITVTDAEAHTTTASFTLRTYASTISAPASVPAGGTIALSGAGFQPGTYDLVLHSDPVALGTVTVGPDGALSARAIIPASTPVGPHELVLSLDGTVVATVPLTVTAAVAAPAPTPTPPAGTVATPAAAGLASTGSSSAFWLGGAALALLAAGAAAVGMRRRPGRSA